MPFSYPQPGIADLTFSDEFGKALLLRPIGSTDPAAGQWEPCTAAGTHDDGGQNTFSSLAYDKHNPFIIQGGALNIAAGWRPGSSPLYGARPYLGGILQTKSSFMQAYGYFEVQLSASPKLGQIGGVYLSNGLTIAEVTSGQDTKPHTYGLLWTKDGLTWTKDGVVTKHQTQPPSDPAFLIVQNKISTAGKLIGGGFLTINYIRVGSMTGETVSKIKTRYVDPASGGGGTPAVFATQPTVSPASGPVGTVFTGNDGTLSSGTITGRQMFFNGTPVANPYTSTAAGSVTYQNVASGTGGAGSTTATSAASTVTAATPAPAFTAQPSISPSTGTGGATFTGSDGTITNGTVSARQWFLNGTAISGATTNSYTSQATDNGSLTYQVTASGAGGSTSATSSAATVTAVGAPSFTAQPSISPTSGQGGTTYNGSDGTISNGTVSARQWLLNGTAISGATSASYTSLATDNGSLTYRVTATGPGGSNSATSSAATVTAVPAPAFTAQPSITPTSGTGGQTFTGNDGTITNGTVSARQWLLGGTAISGANGSSYVSQSTDNGSLTYRVTANGSGGTTSATSAPATVTAASGTFTPPGASAPYQNVFVEDFSTPLSFRTGGPTSAGYESGTGRYAIGPYYRGDSTAGASEPRGFFENNNVGGNPIANCYVDPTSSAWAAAGFDPLSLYKINNGVLEFHNKRVSNADGSIVPGMEAVAAFFPSGSYAEKWLCGWLTTAHSVFATVPMYMEHTTQYAGGVGNWPTMWLLGRNRVLNRSANDLEIDNGEALGQYGPNAALNFTAHNQIASSNPSVGNATITGAVGGGGVAGAYDWAGSGGPRYLPGQTTANPAYNPTTAFHTYGALVLTDRAIFSMDGIVLHTAMFTPNSTGGWSIPPLGMYMLLSMGGMGGNGGVPTPGQNEFVNKVKTWRFAQPA